MSVPIVSFVCWNRAGLTARNLLALLETTDNFELHIVDSNSEDQTWEFIKTLNDPRIKEIKKLDLNRGCTYALNYVLAQRKKDQYFIHIDSDTNIKTKDWIKKFMEVMTEFKDVGAVCTSTPKFLNDKAKFFKRRESNGIILDQCDFVSGCCICIKPELIEVVGYFNEETSRCDQDFSQRVSRFTNFKMGYVPSVVIDQAQRVLCNMCNMNELCMIKDTGKTCFNIRDSKYKNVEFSKIYVQRFLEYLNEIYKGKRTIYCASIHDEESMKLHYYNKEWAEENFNYYIENSN